MSSPVNRFPGQMPIPYAGREPLPPGISEDERPQYEQMKKWEGYTRMAQESCITKTVLAGGMGTSKSATLNPLMHIYRSILTRIRFRCFLLVDVRLFCI